MCFADRRWWSGLLLAAVACGDHGAGPENGVPGCVPQEADIALAVAEYVSLDPATHACLGFPANASAVDTVEYLIVAQAATGEPGRSASFSLRGGSVGGMPVLAAAQAPGGDAPASPAERFHQFLRSSEASGWAQLARGAAPDTLARRALSRVRADVGDTAAFSVCAELDCSRFEPVTAVARAVGERVAIYVDTAAPAAGLNDADLDSLKTAFDSSLYPVSNAAFGPGSDVNQDSVVIVLMSAVVNRMVTGAECDLNGFVSGFFFGFDLDPLFRDDGRSNQSEILYTVVADPSGALSCAHSRSQIKQIVPVTLIHELQHMISFNHHVLLRGGPAEVLWLNEALSHFAEELGGREFPSGSAEFSRFNRGNVVNAYDYLDATADYFLLPGSGAGSLAERGAGWLFLRFLVDQSDADLTRRLVQTTHTGAENVVMQTGTPFDRWLARWALANWVSDVDSIMPGFAAPPELRYLSWRFRRTFSALHSQNPWGFPKPFPLVPTIGAADGVNLAGTLRAGSGAYHRALQPPRGRRFSMALTALTGEPLPASLAPRLTIIRLR